MFCARVARIYGPCGQFSTNNGKQCITAHVTAQRSNNKRGEQKIQPKNVCIMLACFCVANENNEQPGIYGAALHTHVRAYACQENNLAS